MSHKYAIFCTTFVPFEVNLCHFCTTFRRGENRLPNPVHRLSNFAISDFFAASATAMYGRIEA